MLTKQQISLLLLQTLSGLGDNLEITIDKDSEDDIADTIAILDAFDANPDTGTGSAAFTINIEYGSDGNFAEVSGSFWHNLA